MSLFWGQFIGLEADKRHKLVLFRASGPKPAGNRLRGQGTSVKVSSDRKSGQKGLKGPNGPKCPSSLAL